MNCKSCGYRIGAELLSCPGCGRPLHDDCAASDNDPEFNSYGLLRGAECRLGPYHIFRLDETEELEDRTPGRKQSRGTARLWEVTGPRNLHLRVADVQWVTGERDVRAERRYPDSSTLFDQLVRRVRMPIERHDETKSRVVLRQARYNNRDRVTLCTASPEQLSAGAGMPVLTVLHKEFGLTECGTLRSLCGESGRSSGLLCGLFPTEDTLTPIAAYILTRVAPTCNGYGGPDAMRWSA